MCSGKNLLCASASAILWRDSTDGSPRKTTTPRLYRLDAWPRLPPDVSNALLRFVAGRRRARRLLHQMVSTRWNAARSALPVPGWSLVRASHRPDAHQGCLCQRNRSHHDPPRRRNLRARFAVSRAGVHSGPALGALDRSLASRHPERDRPVDDLYGNRLATHKDARRKRNSCDFHRARNRARHPAPVDDLANSMATLVFRVIHQRRSHLRQPSALALSNFSLGSICVRWFRFWVFAVQQLG